IALRTSADFSKPDNIIIFGASGFNRQFVVEEAQSAEGPSGSLKCALAGQSRQWLEGVLNHASKSDAPYVLTEVEIFMADVSEADSWAIICQQGLVVLNCVGPVIMSVVVVETWEEGACKEYADCVNAAGPPQQSGVIGSCGFDSIPMAALLVVFTALTSCFLQMHYGKCSLTLKKKFDHQPLPLVGAKVKKRASLLFSKHIVEHAISFIGSAPWVVRRFQQFSFGVLTKAGPSRKQPGYVATPVAMVQTAFTILNEPQFLPIKSLSLMTFPGAAFARTTLINHLSRHGLVFSVKRF
uniref:Saccharopine dehydrogenase NADP binding domain-containing protein n=1 Tax=Oncorhynchus kisutch TaxID=8019 RepID=A0A8C7DWN9_ONCKI